MVRADRPRYGLGGPETDVGPRPGGYRGIRPVRNHAMRRSSAGPARPSPWPALRSISMPDCTPSGTGGTSGLCPNRVIIVYSRRLRYALTRWGGPMGRLVSDRQAQRLGRRLPYSPGRQ